MSFSRLHLLKAERTQNLYFKLKLFKVFLMLNYSLVWIISFELRNQSKANKCLLAFISYKRQTKQIDWIKFWKKVLIFKRIEVQTNNKWYAFQLNSKFDKTLKILLKSLITIWYRKELTLYLYLLLFCNKSFH